MKKTQTKKLPKFVTQEFVDSIQSLSAEELKARIVELQVQNEINEQFKESKQYIQAKSEFDYAKETFDMVAGPVKDTTVSIKNRTKLLVERLQELGKV